MSTGLAVFDTTVQESNTWLKMVETRLKPCDRQQAYGAFRAVVHVLRDRLPMDAVLGLSAQLPMLLRGVFLEGWKPSDGPTSVRDPQVFADQVKDRLPPGFPREATGAINAVFSVMIIQLDEGEVKKVIAHLPEPLRGYWNHVAEVE
jgi:uncharacterized protein (DUF2267 family)